MSLPFSKYVVFKKKSDLLKIVAGYCIILLFAASPILIAIVGCAIEEKVKGHAVNEGNSGIFAFGWLALLTIPAGLVLIILWTITSVQSVILFLNERSKKIT